MEWVAILAHGHLPPAGTKVYAWRLPAAGELGPQEARSLWPQGNGVSMTPIRVDSDLIFCPERRLLAIICKRGIACAPSAVAHGGFAVASRCDPRQTLADASLQRQQFKLSVCIGTCHIISLSTQSRHYPSLVSQAPAHTRHMGAIVLCSPLHSYTPTVPWSRHRCRRHSGIVACNHSTMPVGPAPVQSRPARA
jgi:hypothetical protein